MRYIILVLLCALNLSASAQWWRGDFKKHDRYTQLNQVKDVSLIRFLAAKPAAYNPKKLDAGIIPRSQFNLEINERIV
ncbi:MAG: hypothetical protein EOP54_19010, partial [Sphingobacteriales bacterium]